jgi:hypothetical protein
MHDIDVYTHQRVCVAMMILVTLSMRSWDTLCGYDDTCEMIYEIMG